MKTRQPRKPRNPMARALYENKLFSHKVVPLKKGKGVTYKRTKDWKNDSGPFSFLLDLLGENGYSKFIGWLRELSDFCQPFCFDGA